MAEGITPQPDPTEKWDHMILRYLEGEDSLEFLKEIRQLLPDPNFQAKLAHYALDTVHLIEFISNALPPAAGEVDLSIACLSSEHQTERRQSTFFQPTNWSFSRLTKSKGRVAAIAAILLLAFLFTENYRRSRESGFQAPGESLFLCTLKDSVDRVYIGDESVDNLDKLAAGQTIRTVGALSSVRLVFADGTTIQLTGDTALRIYETRNQKQLYLDYGHATAEVSPQPRGKPLMLYTSTAELEVVGTEFTVSDLPESTELNVTEGVVLMRPRGGGEGVAVNKGEYSEVRLMEILPPFEMVSAPVSWTEDFDEGLPKEWAHGKWIQDSKKGSSGGAVAPPCVDPPVERDDFRESSKFHVIRSQENWSSGLVRVLEDTELSYRIKMDRPQWYQVFLSVRGEPVHDSRWSWNYEYQEVSTTPWPEVEPGEWREIRVPLSEFKRAGGDPLQVHFDPFELRGGAPPPVGGLVVYVMFSTQTKDRGLVIDDITIGPPQTKHDLLIN